MVAFVEYLLHGLEISYDMNIDQMRSRYAVSLYSYDMMKQWYGEKWIWISKKVESKWKRDKKNIDLK